MRNVGRVLAHIIFNPARCALLAIAAMWSSNRFTQTDSSRRLLKRSAGENCRRTQPTFVYTFNGYMLPPAGGCRC